MSRRSDILRPLAALVLGVLVFAAGLEAARRWLPEWQAEIPEKAFFLQRSEEVVSRLGFKAVAGSPQVSLAADDEEPRERFEDLDGSPPEAAVAVGASVWVRVLQRGTFPGDDRQQRLRMSFSPLGTLLALTIDPEEPGASQADRRAVPPEQKEDLARLLVAPGESLGERSEGNLPEGSTVAYDLVGSDPPQHVRVEIGRTGSISASREDGGLEPISGESDDVGDWLLLAVLFPVIPGILTVLILFPLLLGRRRIDLLNGAVLGLLTLLSTLAPVLLAPDWAWRDILGNTVGGLFLALWTMMIWSTGESFLRVLQPGLALHLDSLRAGRLGPRSGRAILYGLSAGVAVAGVQLGIHSLSWALPGWWPQGYSLVFPFFDAGPYLRSSQLAGTVALALALGLRFLPSRWATWGAGLLAGLTTFIVSVHPIAAYLVANLALAGLLVVLCRRQGLMALLAASFAFYLLPAAVFSGFHLQWLSLHFALSAAPLALFLGTGLVGLTRPAEGETEGLKSIGFMRRIEDERRLKFEMDLLSRMQHDLLPAEPPEVPGWEIAARSLIANEAGGDLYDFIEDEDGWLWIAAGDVAGHGYSCAIVQAMTTAALSSLVSAEKTPSDVLRGVDRVIRRGSSRRNFTTLALLRLDPRTGEALFANAGHPYPFLSANGDAAEIPLSGLPLGQGPERTYRDHRFEIPPGGSLVFCSDGLFEAVDGRQTPYGFDRPRELLRSLGGRSAAGILDALLADWHRHLKTEEPPDDTTVVVVRRLASP